MDEKELELLRLRVQVIAQRVILDWLTDALKSVLIPYEEVPRSLSLKAMKKRLDAARSDYLQMTFSELPPEQSDLIAGELQEAFDAVARQVEKSLGMT